MTPIPEAAVEAALAAQHRAYDEADPAPGPFAWPDDFAKCDQVVMRRAMRAAIEAAAPLIAPPDAAVEALSHDDTVRLSRMFNYISDLRTAEDRRINGWLKRLLARSAAPQPRSGE